MKLLHPVAHHVYIVLVRLYDLSLESEGPGHLAPLRLQLLVKEEVDRYSCTLELSLYSVLYLTWRESLGSLNWECKLHPELARGLNQVMDGF